MKRALSGKPAFTCAYVLVACLLVSCGKGPANTTLAEPPALSYSSSTLLLPVNQAMTAATLTVTTPVTSVSVSPALPAGLSMDASGTISGTPTATSNSAESFVVTGFNGYGSDFVQILIWVYTSPTVTYAGPYTATHNQAMTTIAPVITGGPVTNCLVSPALPNGLNLNTTSCAVSGTPTASVANQTYNIQASNSAGTDTTSFSLQVN